MDDMGLGLKIHESLSYFIEFSIYTVVVLMLWN